MSDNVRDEAEVSTAKKSYPVWKVAGAVIVGFVFLQIVLFILLQFLVAAGVLPAIFRLDAAAVELSVAGLDFLARIAWPVAVIALVLLFAPAIAARFPHIARVWAKWFGLEIGVDIQEKTDEGQLLKEKRQFLEEIIEKVKASIAAVEPPSIVLDSEQPYVSVTDHATRALENVNKEEESLYRPYFDALPENLNALLLCLHTLARPAMVKLEPALQMTRDELIRGLRTLEDLGLAFKEGKGIPYRPRELGRLYLDWLNRARPKSFKAAVSRCSGVE